MSDSTSEFNREYKEWVDSLRRYLLPNFNTVLDILPEVAYELNDFLSALEMRKTHKDNRAEFSDKNNFQYELWIEKLKRSGPITGRIFPVWVDRNGRRVDNATTFSTKRYPLSSHKLETISQLEKNGNITKLK